MKRERSQVPSLLVAAGPDSAVLAEPMDAGAIALALLATGSTETEIAEAVVNPLVDQVRKDVGRSLRDAMLASGMDVSMVLEKMIEILDASVVHIGHGRKFGEYALTQTRELAVALLAEPGMPLNAAAGKLVVKGDLKLEGLKTPLPEHVEVHGDLFLGGTKFLPKVLIVKGLLALSGSLAKSLPERLEVDGTFWMNGCKNIKAIPVNARLGQRFDACDSGLESLPENSSFYELKLSRCKSLKRLPEGLRVEYKLDLEGCTSLRELPARLVVGSKLNLKGCTSWNQKFPDDLPDVVMHSDDGCCLEVETDGEFWPFLLRDRRVNMGNPSVSGSLEREVESQSVGKTAKTGKRRKNE